VAWRNPRINVTVNGQVATVVGFRFDNHKKASSAQVSPTRRATGRSPRLEYKTEVIFKTKNYIVIN
jgi:hypothetical protein